MPDLTGFENSRPVRIGNGAYNQKQNDSYGYLMESGYAVKFIDLTREQQLDVIARTCHEHMVSGRHGYHQHLRHRLLHPVRVRHLQAEDGIRDARE